MTAIQNAHVNAIVSRVKNLLTAPAAEWEKIAGEQTTIKGLYMNYAVILAALPAFGMFVMTALKGASFLGYAFAALVSGYVTSLLMVAAMGFVVDFLAPKFGGTANQQNAFKLCVYSMTPMWLGGLGFIFPYIGSLVVLAGFLYSLYLFFLGVHPLMKAPQNQAGIFTVVAFVCGILVAVVIGAITPRGV